MDHSARATDGEFTKLTMPNTTTDRRCDEHVASDGLPGRQDRIALWALLAIVAAAASLRLYWLFTQTFVIEPEGAVYARIASNLVNGRGYVSTLEGGTELVFPPLYPLLIAFVSFFTNEFELAARLVSVICGSLLVVVLFYITKFLYNLRAALVAATIAALHLVLIRLSASAYSEGLFIVLTMTGIYWSLRAISLERRLDPLLAGACFGLAYLARPEGLFYAAALVAAITLTTILGSWQFKRAIAYCALAMLAFSIVALPYVIFLSMQLGEFRVEGKGLINLLLAERMNSGMSFHEASYAIGSNLEQEGVALEMNTPIRKRAYPKVAILDAVKYALRSARRNDGPLYSKIFDPANGFPLMLVFITLGFCSQPWQRPRFILEAAVFCFFALHVLVLLSMHLLMWRYVMPLFPFLMIWNAHGIDRMTAWFSQTVENVIGWKMFRSAAFSWGIAIVLMALLMRICAQGGRDNDDLQWTDERYLPVKEAGLWLEHYMPGPKNIMDVEAVLPYYANGTLHCLPYADSALCLRYLEAKQPDFIVLKSRQKDWRPVTEPWITDGIPSPHAELIYEAGESGGDRDNKVVIYRWHATVPNPNGDAASPEP